MPSPQRDGILGAREDVPPESRSPCVGTDGHDTSRSVREDEPLGQTPVGGSFSGYGATSGTREGGPQQRDCTPRRTSPAADEHLHAEEIHRFSTNVQGNLSPKLSEPAMSNSTIPQPRLVKKHQQQRWRRTGACKKWNKWVQK